MSQVTPPVRYALARSGESWPESSIAGLVADPNGDLRLARVPGLSVPSLGVPADLGVSGLALDDQCGLFVADTIGNRIVRVALDCGGSFPGFALGGASGVPGEPEFLIVPGAQPAGSPGVLKQPRGLCFGAHGWLFAANGDGQVLTFSLPDLNLRGGWSGLQSPTALACHKDQVLVIDSGAKRLLKYDAFGKPDTAFNSVMVPPAAPADPCTVAIGNDGSIYVGDRAGGSVWLFDWSGASAGPAIAPGTQPRALLVTDTTLFVGDATSGEILLFGLPGGRPIGAVGGFRGSVTALALAENESLFIKTGLDDQCVVATAESWYISSGALTFGPLDAGEESRWSRAAAKCVVDEHTSVRLEHYSDDISNPVGVGWLAAPCNDLLLDGRRYLWLRVTLSSLLASASPSLVQLEAHTAGDSYLDYLPYVYTHDPDRPGLSKLVVEQEDPSQFEPGDLGYLRALYSRSPVEADFISRVLELARSQLGDLELEIADLHKLCDPATTPAAWLNWLSTWMAFDLPMRLKDGRHPQEVRHILLELAELYRRRSTFRGLPDFVELYSNVRPHIFEEFRARPAWVLDETGLGFGSGLPDRELEGVLVGESVVGETGPEDASKFGLAAFASTAHRFSVLVPPARGLDGPNRNVITRIVEAEKPAHTAVHICFLKPSMKVGLQARVGLDAIVALEPEPISLDEGADLGIGTRLAGVTAGAAGALGRHGQVGIDTRLG
jgi:phage tail-like protein